MTKEYHTVSPRGLEKYWGDRVFIEKNGREKGRTVGRLEINAEGDFYVQAGRERVAIENGDTLRMHIASRFTGLSVDYVFVDDSD